MANFLSSNLPVHLALIFTQFLTAITTLATQAILSQGVNQLVLGCYCLFLAGIVLAIASFFFERGRNVEISFGLLRQLLVFGFFICVIQILGLVGLSNTSASFVSGMHPVSSVFTAAFAMIFGVEKLRFRSLYGQAKIAGILVCTGGAILMSVYKGPCVLGIKCSPPLSETPMKAGNSNLDFQLGAICVILSCIVTGALATYAAKLLKERPAPIKILSITFVIGATVSGTAAVFFLDKSAFLLSGNLVFIVMLISVFSLSIFPVLMLWSIMRLGPTIVGCYTPLNTIITSLFSSIFLGSIIGAFIILIGLLLVSWAQEETIANEEPSSEEQPFMQKIEAINLA